MKIVVEGKEVAIEAGQTLLEAVALSGIRITSPCGGKGKCGKCLVRIDEGYPLRRPTPIEEMFLEAEDLREGYRLACQVRPEGEVRVSVPDESREVTTEVLLKHATVKSITEPALTVKTCSGPDAERLTSSVQSLSELIGGEGGVSGPGPHGDELKALIGSDRLLIWSDDGKVVSVTAVRKRYGVALDIGSTTMVAYAFDILDQSVAGVESTTNPQRRFGEDVMTRIDLAMRGADKRQELEDALRGGVAELLSRLTDKLGAELGDILRLTFVGNTAMHHFFLGLDITRLGRVPFEPDRKDPTETTGLSLGLTELDNCIIAAPPVIAGFVGADLVAVLLATGLADLEEPTAAIDIGTNAEIALAADGRLLCCSAAAGPAFEGGNITCGMRATEGAICRVWSEDGDIRFDTIGGSTPIGLCGSGLIDFVSEGLRLGMIDSAGAFVKDCCGDRLIGRHGRARYLLFSDGRREVSVTQGDVRQLQLAKAAMYAGLEILTDKLGLGRIGRLLLAGAFGANMSTRNGRLIGMFPELPLDAIVPVGNAAGTGAIQLLTDMAARREVLRVAAKAEYVELSRERDFQKRFIAALDFPHADMSKYPESARVIRTKVER